VVPHTRQAATAAMEHTVRTRFDRTAVIVMYDAVRSNLVHSSMLARPEKECGSYEGGQSQTGSGNGQTQGEPSEGVQDRLRSMAVAEKVDRFPAGR